MIIVRPIKVKVPILLAHLLATMTGQKICCDLLFLSQNQSSHVGDIHVSQWNVDRRKKEIVQIQNTVTNWDCVKKNTHTQNHQFFTPESRLKNSINIRPNFAMKCSSNLGQINMKVETEFSKIENGKKDVRRIFSFNQWNFKRYIYTRRSPT